ncbi:MAG: hypothetical protein ACL93V_13145 [Candidatus Electrothrix sp. YB6]
MKTKQLVGSAVLALCLTIPGMVTAQDAPEAEVGIPEFGACADLQYGQIMIDTTPGHGDRDHARFKMTGLAGLGDAVATGNPVSLSFSIATIIPDSTYHYGCIGTRDKTVYEFSGAAQAKGGNTLRFMSCRSTMEFLSS